MGLPSTKSPEAWGSAWALSYSSLDAVLNAGNAHSTGFKKKTNEEKEVLTANCPRQPALLVRILLAVSGVNATGMLRSSPRHCNRLRGYLALETIFENRSGRSKKSWPLSASCREGPGKPVWAQVQLTGLFRAAGRNRNLARRLILVV